MDSESSFQLKCPLSKRKFWKKILERAFFLFILAFLAGGFSAMVLLQETHQEFSTSNIVGNTIISVFVIFVVLQIILLLTYGFYLKAYINRYYYDCSDKVITIRKGVFSVTEIHVQYSKIQDVFVDQDLLDRLLGLYDVHISSTTVNSDMEAHIDGVDSVSAEFIKTLILKKISGGSNSLKNETSMIKQKISTETYPISNKWLVISLIRALFYPFFLAVITLWIAAANTIRDNASFALKVSEFTPYALLGGGVLFIIIFVSELLWKNNYYFEFLPDYIQLKTGIIAKSESHFPYKVIQDITISRGVFERLLGLSTVTIMNASQFTEGYPNSSSITIPGQPREKAEELVKSLNKMLGKLNKTVDDSGV